MISGSICPSNMSSLKWIALKPVPILCAWPLTGCPNLPARGRDSGCAMFRLSDMWLSFDGVSLEMIY